MKSTVIYDNDQYRWIVLARDPDKPEKVIDTNQYLVVTENRTLLLDPGGVEIFGSMLAATLHHTRVENITDIFASHQDPDIISSLNLWDQAVPRARLHAPWLWEGFIRHFGLKNIEYVPLPDEGGVIDLEVAQLQLIPAHYLHSSGNFQVYDPNAKILMSGDVGAAIEHGDDIPMFVEDFDAHTRKMKRFHERWMPSERAKQDWLRRVRNLDVEIMAPQHGRLFQRDDAHRFLDWFEKLEVGVAVSD